MRYGVNTSGHRSNLFRGRSKPCHNLVTNILLLKGSLTQIVRFLEYHVQLCFRLLDVTVSMHNDYNSKLNNINDSNNCFTYHLCLYVQWVYYILQHVYVGRCMGIRIQQGYPRAESCRRVIQQNRANMQIHSVVRSMQCWWSYWLIESVIFLYFS